MRWVSGWVGKAQTLAQVTSRQGVTELTAGRDGIARQTAVCARVCVYINMCAAVQMDERASLCVYMYVYAGVRVICVRFCRCFVSV